MASMLPSFTALLLIAATSTVRPEAFVYFPVSAAADHASSLSAVYTNNADALVTVSALVAHNVSPSYDCCIEGPGDFIFTGWSVKDGPIDWNRYLEFTVTAKAPISFNTLKYSAFGGLYSNMGGPRGIIVKASRDGFAANEQTLRLGGWNVAQTSPYIGDSPNDFVDALSSLGQLAKGETMTFRFYMVYTDYGSIPGGLWNKSANDHNPTLSFSGVAPLAIRVSQVELCWGTVTNTWYQLQYSSSLTTNFWKPVIAAWTPGTGGMICTNQPVLAGPQTYYRLATTNAPPQ